MADFDEVWQCDASLPSELRQPINFAILKIKDGGSGHLLK